MIQEVMGLVRSPGFRMMAATDVQLGPSHPILAWAVRQAAWLLARFQVKSSGKTAHWTRVR